MKQFPNIDPLNILVVEDNFGDFVLLKESIYLSSIPATHIELADSLESAINYLCKTTPDLIFLDLFLPDSTGIASFEEIKKYMKSSAVIVLSGLSDTMTAVEAIGKGAQDYLSKGEFDIKLLEKTIIYALERRRSLESLQLANERYRLVSKATNDLIWDWDLLDNRVYRDEQAVRAVYGYSSNEVIPMIKDWSARIHPEDRSTVDRVIKEVVESNEKDSFEFEYKFLTENGNYKLILDRGYAVRNPEGKAIRLVGAARDITAKRKLEIELKEAEARQQRAITEATIKGQENEREQLGIELHDNITQILATSKLYLDYAFAGPEVKKEIVMQSKQLIVLATNELRKLSHALLPPSLEEFGLTQALEELTGGIAQTEVFSIEKTWSEFNEKLLKREQKLTIYRIVQEQLNNIMKHAGAKKVMIALCHGENSNNVKLVIKDDGKGFNTAQTRTGVGLRNITSRAELFGGSVKIQSTPGNGCELEVLFPIKYSHTNPNN
jgi:two-component system sensor histidine kinase UhpB